MANRKNCSLHIVFFLESSSSRSRQSKKDGWNKFSDFFVDTIYILGCWSSWFS